MSGFPTPVDARLTAPLKLPAVPGKPLTTEGGNTLDDGSGNAVLLNATTLHSGLLLGPNAPAVGGVGIHSDGKNIYLEAISDGAIYLSNTLGSYNNVVTVNSPGPGIFAPHLNAPATTPALPANPPVSGSVYQNTTGGPIFLAIPITATAIGGSAQLALGTTASPAVWGGAEQIGVSGELRNVNLMVPNNSYWSITVVNATIGSASVLGQ